MGKLDELLEQYKKEDAKPPRAVKATAAIKQALADRDLPFTIIGLQRRTRGGRLWWDATIEIQPGFFEAYGQGIPGRVLLISLLDSPGRARAYSEIAGMLPYGDCVLVHAREGNLSQGYQIVDAPPRKRKGPKASSDGRVTPSPLPGG